MTDSTVCGIPLTEETLGTLTVGGFFSEVCQTNA